MSISHFLELTQSQPANAGDSVVIADDDMHVAGKRQAGVQVVALVRDENQCEVCIVIGIDKPKERWTWQRFCAELSGMLETCGTYTLVASVVIAGGKPYARIDFPAVACAVDRSQGMVYVLVKGLKNLDRMIEDLSQQLDGGGETG